MAPELRPLVAKFRVPMASPLLRCHEHGHRVPSPGRTVPGVRFERRYDAGREMRMFIPEVRTRDGALMWIHGGGLILGDPATDDRFCAEIARNLGIVVAWVRYRLAPAHPYPAAIDDCHDPWPWIWRSAHAFGLDPARVAIGGQSAGGGLDAALVQWTCDGRPPHPVAQWLLCPMLDDRTAARRNLDAEQHFVWNNRMNLFGWRACTGSQPGGSATRPLPVLARRDDIRNTPPAWIGVGVIDLFFNEHVPYAERLIAAGVLLTLEVVPGSAPRL